MKRWLVVLIVAIIAVSSAIYLRDVFKTGARKRRESAYQAALQTYSQNLKPGLNRKDVESYLRARNIGFTQMCCVLERSAFADLVKVGQEDAPWYCSEQYIYIAFEFRAAEAHSLQSPIYDSDRLKTVEIFPQLSGCL